MDEELCSAISERTGESLKAVQNLSLQEKIELAQALGLQQQLAKSGEADRKKKLDDDEIEQLLCEDDDQPEVNLTQQTGKLKRKNISPPNSPVFRKRKYSSAPKEKWLLESKDEKSEQHGSSKELEQSYQGMEPDADWVKLSARKYRVADVSSEEVEGDSKTDVANSASDQFRSNKEQLPQSLGLNSNAGGYDVSSDQVEDCKSDGASLVKIKFGGISNCFENFENQGAAQDRLTGAESLHLPTYLVTEAQKRSKSSNMMKKLAKMSLTRTSSPLSHLPKLPIVDLGRLEDANQSSTVGEIKDLQSSLASLLQLVHQLKQGGLSLASSPSPRSSWQSLVKTSDLVRSVAGPGRLSSGRRISRPESPNMAADKVPEDEKIAYDDSIEESISEEDVIEETESEDDDEYTPKKAGLEWWKNKAQSKVKRTKGKGRGKVKKLNNCDQQNISKYFKPKDEAAEMEEVDNDGEVEEVTDLEGIAEEKEVAISSSFVGKCPLCNQGFSDVDKLSTHASNCQDTA